MPCSRCAPGRGETIWRFDRDGPKPKQVMPPQVAADMAFMMNKVVEEGTARRAILNGIKAAGKTGTTNAYRDAWFVGYTGNFVCGVWFGNDDYRPLNRMTGGSVPAMTWHTVMEYAHQGIELKNIPGLPPNPATIGPQIARGQGRRCRARRCCRAAASRLSRASSGCSTRRRASLRLPPRAPSSSRRRKTRPAAPPRPPVRDRRDAKARN